jgi:hypothetical protein
VGTVQGDIADGEVSGVPEDGWAGGGEAFPPEPWRLVGDMYASVWRVPVRELPRWRLPRGVRPLVLGRRATLVTFWVDYLPDGTLAYRELLAALAVRHRGAVAATVVAAWVDDDRSLRGGRTLWGIPKEPATFRFEPGGSGELRTGMTTPDGAAAHSTHRPGLRLPGRAPLRTHLVQDVDGAAVRVPLRLSGRPRLARTSFTAGPGGPLAFLDGHAPAMTLALTEFRFTVGEDRHARR